MIDYHNIVWTEEVCNRLQGFYADNPPVINTYWSYQVGEGVVNFTKHYLKEKKSPHVLDYGCGPGFLIGYFLKEGFDTFGVDMSPESVAVVNQNLGNDPKFHGAKVFDGGKLPYPDDFFDAITCTEVIEHVLDKHIDIFLNELRRILKPEGCLILTTPNDENMKRNQIYCPECGALFHKWGHVRKFTQKTLINIMEDHGWKTKCCNCTNFARFQPDTRKSTSVFDVSINTLKRAFVEWLHSLRANEEDIFLEKIGNGPHLFYVGTK